MSVPWGSPESAPLADIRKFMRAAEQKTRTTYNDMYWVAAPSLRQAAEWAYRNGVPLWQMQYLSSPSGLYGLKGGTVVVVNGGWPGSREDWEAHLRMLELTGVTVQRAST